MTDLSPVDEVLETTAELLKRPDASSVSDVQVLSELRWPIERERDVRYLVHAVLQTDPFLTAGGGSSPEGTWDLIIWGERCH